MVTFRHIYHTASGAMLLPTNLSVGIQFYPVAHKIHVCMCAHTHRFSITFSPYLHLGHPLALQLGKA